jgi:hypothetical protein
MNDIRPSPPRPSRGLGVPLRTIFLSLGTLAAVACSDEFGALGRWEIPKPSIRLSLGTAPSIDDISSNASYNGQSVPGISGGSGNWYESEAGLNPAFSLEVIGPGSSVFSSEESRFGVALGWNRRLNAYSLDGFETPEIRVDTFGLSLLGGRVWPLGQNLSFEALGRFGGGFLRSREYIIAPDTATWEVAGDGRGGYIEAAARGALVWASGEWLFGAQLEYVVGSGYAKWDEAGTLGDSTGTSHYAWYGFGAALFVGHEF